MHSSFARRHKGFLGLGMLVPLAVVTALVPSTSGPHRQSRRARSPRTHRHRGSIRRARKGIENFNVSDWQAVRELCAPGYVYEETGTGRRITDLDELVAALQAWKAALPDVTGEVLRVVSAGDTTVMEVRWTGTQSGPLDLGGTVLPPSGRA